MKTIKFIMAFFVLVLVFTFMDTVVYADTEEPAPTITTMGIAITIPEEFNANITLYFENTETGDSTQLLLTNQHRTNENRYINEFVLPAGYSYILTYTIGGGGYELEGVNELLEVTEAVQTIDLQLYPMDEIANFPDQPDINNNPYYEEDELNLDDLLPTNRPVNEVWDELHSALAYMETDEEYAWILDLYSSEKFKQYFLMEPMNYLELWEELTLLQRFEYYIAVYLPKTIIYESDGDITRSDFLSQLDTTKRLLSRQEDGEKAFNAIFEVWVWHWSNWEYGTFIDIFDYNLTTYQVEPEPEQQEAEDDPEDQKTLNSTEDQPEQTTAGGLLAVLKKNTVSLVILAATGITVLVVAYIRNKQNIDED